MLFGGRARTIAAAGLLAFALAACGGAGEESRNAAFTGGDLIARGSEDSPYTLETGPDPLAVPLQGQVLAQSFRSHSSPTSLTDVSVGISNSVGGFSSVGSFTLTLHLAGNGEPGPAVAVLGTRTVDEFFSGSKIVAPNQLVPLTPSTDYFVVMTRDGGAESHVNWRTVMNSPLTNVSPPPTFVGMYSTNEGAAGSWNALEDGRAHLMRVSVVASGEVTATSTSGPSTTLGSIESTPATVDAQAATTVAPRGTTAPSTTTDGEGTTTDGEGTTAAPGDVATTTVAGATAPTTSVPGGAVAPTDTAATDTTVAVADSTPPVADTTAPAGDATTTGADDGTRDISSAGALDRVRYSPANDPETTSDVAVTLAAFAAIAFAGGALAGAVVPGGAPTGGGSGGGPARLSTLATKRLRRRAAADGARGDASRTWKWPGTAAVDAASSRWPAWWAARSVIVPRVMVDGAWSRAMFGSFGLAPWIAAIAAGILWIGDVDGVVGLPTGWILALALTLSILDATAAALAVATIVVGSAVTGALADWSDVRVLLGTCVLLLSGSLVANVVRPLRRIVVDGDSLRERVLDYVMGPVGAVFALEAMARMLNGLGERPITVDGDLDVLRVTVMLALLVRLALEDVSVHVYPDRTRAVQPEHMDGQRPTWGLAGSAVRFGLYLFVAQPFFGLGPSTIVAAAILTAPFVAEAVGDHLPKFDVVGKWLPRGFVRFFVLLVLATWMSSVMLGDAPTADTVRSVVPWLFLPSAVIGIVEQFGRTGERWPDTKAKLLGGVALWVVGVLILSGVVSF